MKIALLAPGSLPIPSVLDGAIETLTTHIIEENETYNKLDLVIFSNYNDQALKKSLNYKNTRIIFINCNTIRAKLFNLYFRIIRKIKNSKDLPLNYFLHGCIKSIKNDSFNFIVLEGGVHQVLTISKYTNTKIILHVHADILNVSFPNAKLIIEKCYSIITVSNFIRNRVLEIDPQKRDRVHVLRNAVDINLFDGSKYQMQRVMLRLEHKIQDDEKVILFCGRINQGKGIKELLLACEKLDINYKLLIAGASWFNSKNVSKFEREVYQISKRLGDKVIFLGYIPNAKMPEIYSIADISVVPSVCNDAAPLVPLEALAAGLPVIATNIGGIPEHVTTDVGELIEVNRNFVDNLSDAIKKYLVDERYYQRKKSHTKIFIQKFSKEIYYKNFTDLLINKLF
ncbi:MAG: glycosyltransferase family 4 protein [Ignavibacterium sp.]